MKLSVVLATYNEEENIRKSLDSVYEWADEIVIADGTSTDNTQEIAEKEYKARVLVVPNLKNFHVNKQKAIDAAKGAWILQLDADEVVSAGLKKEIDDIIKDPKSQVSGYWIPRKNWFLGRFLMKGGQYPDYTLRLYRNGKGHLPQKDVHEQAVVEGEVGYAKAALLHYPYKNFAAYIHKWQRYNRFSGDLLKTELKNRGIPDKLWICVKNVIIEPLFWFVWTYGRHKGFMDGWSGFVFCLFSALRFPMSYFYYLRQ